ncbi:trihelix transcription factor PTL-like [Solanum pennellii]|uniref:Trihelix transcription factor PTL-like n=1 Tax=Solanum pennellii TaxID=28526 RepID=A0ABM1HNC8_SOLPN|nr:trihelix transcription factor PTL-like [Solanum pennellii]
MEDQYGMADLRQYMNGGRSIFGSIQQVPPELLPATSHQQQQHRNLGPGHHQYDMVMGLAQVPSSSSGHGLTTPHHHHHHQHHQHEFLTDSSTPVAVATATATGATTTSAGFSGMDQMETGGGGGGDGSGRWPRQETLTLLEIRSRLDPKFKEANQKGPLWDEVSRIMSEEHGYQRTGKKCREKFENLYKYYKKTKEGKAGRQDGKHYRFFRQLEALYGETSNNISSTSTDILHQGSHFPYNSVNNMSQDPHNFHHHQASKLSDSMSLSNSSELNTSSSDDSDHHDKKKRRGKRSLKAKIKDFIDGQMRKLMEKQEEWMDKMMKMIEHKEQERILREEEWRKQETIRIEKEHSFWANERAWIETRDAALMEAVNKLSGKDLKSTSSNPRSLDEEMVEIHNRNGDVTDSLKDDVDQHWPDSEITRLIQLRTSMESRFQQLGISSSINDHDHDHDHDNDNSNNHDHVLWEEISAKMAILGYDKSATMCKKRWGSINSYLMKCNKKRKDQNSTSLLCYNSNIQINNQYYEADGSSCFRYLMGDHHQNL